MDNQSDLQAELSTARRQLAEATATAAAHKKLLADAKSKAKAIIQRKVDEADAKVRILEEQNSLQAEELATLKPMLRQVHDQRNALSETCERLQTEFRQLESQNSQLQNRCSSLEADLTDARKETAKSASAHQETDAQLRREVKSLRAELQHFNQSRDFEELSDTHSTVDIVPNGTDVSRIEQELKDAKQSVEQFRLERDRLRAENQSLQEGANEKPDASEQESTDSPSKVSALWEETRQSRERIESLSRELEEAKGEAKARKAEYEKAIREAEAEHTSFKEELATSKARIDELLQNLQKSELALQEEREKFIQEQKSKSESVAQDGVEKNKILEAKVSEMERVVASKQAEIGKVREKAKTYLRELNAEKRAMETKMKEEAESLQIELQDERKKVEAADRRTESSTAEVDNCLALIREKQKSVQMLKMTISTQKSAAEEAARESQALREEFSRYKERARLALREKDAKAESVQTKIETATSALRRDLGAAQKESSHLKNRLRHFEEVQRRYDEVLERAEKAEAAADSLRKGTTGASNASVGQVGILEGKLSTMEAELVSTRAAMGDAKAKLETTSLRFLATEKALRGAEVRAEEAERISQKTIDGQRSHVESLEKELAKARESAASAQRTAAVAAKALAASSCESGDEIQKQRPKPATSIANEWRDRSNMSSFGSPSPIKANRATLAAAIAGHSDSLGLRGSFDSQSGSGQVLDFELEMKKQQISVLTSQISELGTLLEDTQQEAQLRSEQTALLKKEVKNLDAKLAAAEKLQNGAPFSYLRAIIVRYLETDDAALLPVIANVLSFTEEENVRVKERRGINAAPASPRGGYFGLNGLLGSRR